MTQPEIIDGVIQDPGMDAHAISLVNPPSAWLDVLQERQRQVTAKGWTPEHDDDEHRTFELAIAAGCYIDAAVDKARFGSATLSCRWPWAIKWWKPGPIRRDLVKAAALILAEIERLDRAAARGAK